MAEIHEHDAMGCRACGREERASEGYPCANCGTFICLICTFRGVTLCRDLTLGTVSVGDLGHLAYLAGFVTIGLFAARMTYRKRLVV